MAISAEDRDFLVSLYVGYFNRAPDPAGLQFWIDQVEAGRDTNTIAADFAASPEAKSLYPFLTTPDVSSPTSFITAVYANLFNRAPDAAGQAFWEQQLSSGAVSPADAIDAIIKGATTAPDSTILANKNTVGLDFATDAGNTPGFTFDLNGASGNAATSAIAGVTEDASTVIAAQAATDAYLNGVAGVGETLTLTTDTDSGAAFVGGSEDEIFSAPLDTAIDGLVGAQSLQGSDVLDGGAGDDMLNAELNGTGATQNPTISNIEQYNLTSYAGPFGFGNGSLDLSRATGYEQLWNRDSDENLELDNVGEQAVIGMDGVRGGSAYTVDYDTDLAVTDQVVVAQSVGTPTTGAATLNINGTAVDSLELNASASRLNVESEAGIGGTLAVNVEGGNTITLGEDADTAADLVIAGEGALSLSGEDLFPNLVNLDATEYNEDLNLDVSGSEMLENVATGEGDDVITINRLAANGELAVDLGEGADFLEIAGSVDSVDISALNFAGGVAGVENLAFDGAASLNGAAILDLEGFTDLETVWFYGGLDGNGNELTLAGAPADDLSIQSTFIDGLDLDAGNVVNLEANTAAGELDIDALAGESLETLVLNQAGDGDLYLDVAGGADNLNALTSIEANASNEGTYNTAEVDIVDDAGSLTDGLQSLADVSVTSDDAADLTMTGADSGIIAAQDAVDDAQDDVAAAEGVRDAAQDDVDTAETAEDDALVAQGGAQSDLDDAQDAFDDAQADFDAAAAAVDAKEAEIDAKQAEIDAKQTEIDDKEAEITAAEDQRDDIIDFLNDFELLPATISDGNEAALDNYINSSSYSQAVKDALVASAPTSGIGTIFNPSAQSNYNAWVAGAALVATETALGIPALEAEETTLNGELATLNGELATLNGELTPLQTAETDALNALNAAQADLDAAQDVFDDAVDDVTAAGTTLAAAEAVLTGAEEDLADAEAALATAQANLAAATPEGTGFEALETVTVEGGDTADVDLDDVYGAFELEVTAETSATVSLTDTGVVNASVSGGDSFVYNNDNPEDGVNLAEVDFTTVVANGDSDTTYGNQDLTTLTVEGAATDVTLANDLSSFETLDLTGAANWFNVDASDANFAPEAGGFVSYLVGGTASEFGGVTADGGDSQITMADARETVTFTEADFGTIVLDDFTVGADPATGDRIDFSDLGFTNNGQLLFEEGDYDANGEFILGAGDDVRVSDLDGGPEMNGEIILVGIGDSDLLTQFNVTYA